jgi:nucleoid-associated protein YgaU
MYTTQLANFSGQATAAAKSKLGLENAAASILSKLEITYKDEKDQEVSYIFQYNPKALQIEKEVQWESVDGNQKDVNEKQFANGKARVINIKDILVDTTIMGNMSVYTNYIEPLETMTRVRTYKTKSGKEVKRPPYITLVWGKSNYFFECILTKLEYDFKMFTKEGVPIRAELDLTFEEVVTETTKKKAMTNQKSVKTYIVKPRDTLHGIADKEYKDPNKWKIIATANGIEDPMYIPVGTSLTLPSVS